MIADPQRLWTDEVLVVWGYPDLPINGEDMPTSLVVIPQESRPHSKEYKNATEQAIKNGAWLTTHDGGTETVYQLYVLVGGTPKLISPLVSFMPLSLTPVGVRQGRLTHSD